MGVRLPDRVFDDVLELADVAGPPVPLEQLERLRREFGLRIAAPREMGDKGPDVRAPLAERRHVDMDDAQPVEQIFAKLAGRYALGEVAIGCGNHANINPSRSLVGPDPLQLTRFEEPKKKRLHPEAHLPHFVEEEGAAVRRLELADLVAIRAGEAALDVAEQLGLEERLGQPGAVDRHEGTATAR